MVLISSRARQDSDIESLTQGPVILPAVSHSSIREACTSPQDLHSGIIQLHLYAGCNLSEMLNFLETIIIDNLVKSL